MTDRDIEAKLREAISHAAPDCLEQVLSHCKDQEGAVIPMNEKKTRKPIHRWKIWAGAAAAALLLAVGLWGYNANYAIDSIIGIDVNPSVELRINKAEEVVKANALNNDAQIILDDMNLKGVDLDVAVNAIIGSMLKNGYIDELKNSVLISVENDNAAKGEALQQRLAAEIEQLLSASAISGAVLSQTITDDQSLQQLADTYGISVGKAALIQNILKQDTTGMWTFEGLAGLCINDLNLLSASKDTQLQGVSSVGTASSAAYIKQSVAKQTALNDAGVDEASARRIKIELDYDDGRMVYEVEFYVDNIEYDYEIDAATGAIISRDIDRDDDYYWQGNNGNNGNNNGNNNTNNNANNGAANAGSNSSFIGEAKAQSIALEAAGLSESEVYGLRVKLDYEDDLYERDNYEVEFYAGGFEYDYEIDAITGEIISWDKDIDDDYHYQHNANAGNTANNSAINGNNSASATITADEAKNIALAQAGLSASEVSGLWAELDRDDVRTIYEVEFHSGRTEYNYDIDASTGAVISYDIDYDD